MQECRNETEIYNQTTESGFKLRIMNSLIDSGKVEEGWMRGWWYAWPGLAVNSADGKMSYNTTPIQNNVSNVSSIALACERALLFGRVKRVSRKGPSPLGRSLARFLRRLASLAQIGELTRRLFQARALRPCLKKFVTSFILTWLTAPWVSEDENNAAFIRGLWMKNFVDFNLHHLDIHYSISAKKATHLN